MHPHHPIVAWLASLIDQCQKRSPSHSFFFCLVSLRRAASPRAPTATHPSHTILSLAPTSRACASASVGEPSRINRRRRETTTSSQGRPTMSNQRTSRPKPPPPGNEEASATLNLGEFQNVDTLTLSEAALVLNALVAKRRNDRKNVNETEYASRHQGRMGL